MLNTNKHTYRCHNIHKLCITNFATHRFERDIFHFHFIIFWHGEIETNINLCIRWYFSGRNINWYRLALLTEWWWCQNVCLTHWGRVTHICVSKLTIIGSDNGLSPGRRQAIIWTNAGILLIWPLGTSFSEILIEILTFSFTKMRLKVSSAKWQPFCLGLNVLKLGNCVHFLFLGLRMCRQGENQFLPRYTEPQSEPCC